MSHCLLGGDREGRGGGRVVEEREVGVRSGASALMAKYVENGEERRRKSK